MANQARSRADRTREAVPSPIPQRGFPYKPLDPSIDGIRLLVLEPSLGDSIKLMSCRLIHATFGQNPKYEALSYAWGSELDKKPILVDGRQFEVGCNLWLALFRLRSSTKERLLWVDAVCINQADLEERSRQVRIMPHIYGRAQMVLVWLGSYSAPQIETGKWDTYFASVSRGPDVEDAPWLDAPWLEDLCDVDYWDRVWIIQEIIKARRVEVHYGRKHVDWDNFIAGVKRLPKVQKSVAMNLSKQRDDRYGDGCRLENLLKTHRRALCKDPRDKIYGFVGLATDYHGLFPIDYSKSLLEVWKDVVMFRDSDQLAHPCDMLEWGKLTRRLLSLPARPASSGLSRMVESEWKLSESTLGFDRLTVETHTISSGRILHIGPTHTDILSNLSLVDGWASDIRKYVAKRHLPGTYEENDHFLRVLEDLSVAHLSLIFSLQDSDEAEDLYPYGGKPAKGNPRLFILEPESSGYSKTIGRIGLAPACARKGDMICHFPNSELAALVRMEGSVCRTLGTAVLAEDRETARQTFRDNSSKDSKFAVSSYQGLPTDDGAIKISMPLGMLYKCSI